MPKRISPLLPETTYARRRKELIRRMNGGVAILASSPEAVVSRDRAYPYMQNTDFFYLTGFDEPDAALVLRSETKGPASILFLRDRDASREQWEGPRVGLRRAKARFRVDDVRPIADLRKILRELTAGHQTIHYAPGSHPDLDRRIFALFQTHVGPLLNAPNSLADLRLITNEMRIVKDAQEIALMRRAAAITAQSLIDIVPMLPQFSTEIEVARGLESLFTQYGGEKLAFDTLVASVSNATMLHRLPGMQKLRAGEPILIDSGAMLGGYCADITRVMPYGKGFSPAQAVLYDIVHRTLVSVTKRVRPRITLDELQRKTARELTEGLVQAKIIKGSANSVIMAGTYKRYYMHRVSHWLGLDSHDPNPVLALKTGQFQSAQLRPLEAGNVITIEPGLYIDAKDTTAAKEFRGLGIRLEDDVLVTESGHEVLSSRVPSAREEIEALI